jgi:hypothetical protein
VSGEVGLYSTLTAQAVLERLVAVIHHPGVYIEITIVERDADGTESPYPTLWLAPTDEDVSVHPDGSEIIRCYTRGKRDRVSVLVGKPDTRRTQSAKIIYDL